MLPDDLQVGVGDHKLFFAGILEPDGDPAAFPEAVGSDDLAFAVNIVGYPDACRIGVLIDIEKIAEGIIVGVGVITEGVIKVVSLGASEAGTIQSLALPACTGLGIKLEMVGVLILRPRELAEEAGGEG